MKINWKGSALLAPVPPALVTVGDMEKSNVLTIAWTGILNSQPPKTYISVREERHSFPILMEKREFVINLPTQKLLQAVDICGVKSGKNMDKFRELGLTKEPACHVDCPLIGESPVSLECKVTHTEKLGTHHVFYADIVSVNVEESLLNAEGKLCLEKAGLLAYAHGTYFALGEELGTFGFSVEKEKTKQKKFVARSEQSGKEES